MNLIVFEDNNADNFYPLSVSHPVFDLWYGCSSVLNRLKCYFKPSNVILCCRTHLADITREKYKLAVNEFSGVNEDCILVNAALIPEPGILNKLASGKANTAYCSDKVLIGARLSAEAFKGIDLKEIIEDPSTLPSTINTVEIKAPVFNYLWDIINQNNKMIENDIELLPEIKTWGRSNTALKHGESVFIHPSARVPSGAFIDSSNGSVIIDENAVVEPRSLIQGPAYIGKGSVVMAGMIREGCSLGPVSKVGGELEESIILGYSNKCHEGFIGHAYLGEWVNLGAMTTNSDLKNNYGEVSVSLKGENTATGLIKVGCFIGDHTKAGIGTTLNTGIVIGFCNNLYGGSLFTDKEIGHFKWGTPGELVEFRLDKATEVANQAMARRGCEFSKSTEKLFKHVKSL